MRIRKILLIHPSRSIRALLKKYIFAELSDIEIGEADNGQRGLELLGRVGFDVIISAEKLKDMRLDDFKTTQESSAPNGHTPLIIISESESEQDRDVLVRQGFDRVVQIRVNPADLIKKINAVCDPRKWRKDARYHIPNAFVEIETPMHRIKASMINISKGGVFVELSTDDPTALITGSLNLSLQIPASTGPLTINRLTTKLLRFEAVAWADDSVPKTIRATFIFNNLEPGPRGKLAELIQMAKQDKLAATEVAN